MRSRTFGEDTNQAHVLEAAIATLATQAAYRLRRDTLLARRIGLFVDTNRHKPGYRRWVRNVAINTPTSDSGHIISLLVQELASFYSTSQQYHRLGVFLHDFVPEGAMQTDLLGNVDTARSERSAARMRALDTINSKWGKGKIYFAAEDLSNDWRPKHQIRSPRYVSNWNELPTARIAKP
jgi:DNA polymerase V